MHCYFRNTNLLPSQVRSPEGVSPEELRQYFIFLKCEKKVARQTATQAICAIKLFWDKAKP